MTRDPHRPGHSILPETDGEPGPMPPLSAAESDAIAWAAVSRWAARPPGLEPSDDGAGPARPLSGADAEQLAQRVLRVHARRRLGHQLTPWAVRAAAALLCLSGALGVAFAAYRWVPALLEGSSRQNQPPTAARASGPSPAPLPSPQTESAGVNDAGSINAATPDAPRPSRSPRLHSASQSEPGPQLAEGAHTALTPAVASEQLLARANTLRAQRRWPAAERSYRQVAATSASEQQRYVALISAAAIALQHLDKPARALKQYQTALALMPYGNLNEEALFGIAECHRALANQAAELEALRRLSDQHPSGVFTATAKHRRAELEAARAR